MILEDDAKFLLPPPPSLAAVCKEDFDVLFINHRMAFAPEEQSDPRIQIKSVKEVVSFKPPSWRAAGTDGYFISRTGAGRLINWVREDGFWGDIDWRLIFYALGKEWRTCLPTDGFAQTAVSHHARLCKEHEAIRAFVLTPALIGQHRGGSARHSMNGFAHAHLEIKDNPGT
jgi:GR25 family glycosyltransferase involved in LPS biosynthesis